MIFDEHNSAGTNKNSEWHKTRTETDILPSRPISQDWFGKGKKTLVQAATKNRSVSILKYLSFVLFVCIGHRFSFSFQCEKKKRKKKYSRKHSNCLFWGGLRCNLLSCLGPGIARSMMKYQSLANRNELTKKKKESSPIYSLLVVKIYNARNVYYRFSILVVNTKEGTLMTLQIFATNFRTI